jgi:hypothetical protein
VKLEALAIPRRGTVHREARAVELADRIAIRER